MWYKVKRILVGTQQVRPSGWTPWSNTLAYRPLTNDLIDVIGNKSLTYQSPASASKQSLGYRFVGWVTSWDWTNVKLISCWLKVISGSSSNCGLPGIANPSVGYYYKHNESRLYQKFFCWTNSSFGASTATANISTGNRIHFVVCYDQTENKSYGYINWTQYLIYNGAGYSFGNEIMPMSSDSGAGVYSGNLTVDISDLIFESKSRTAQEVSDYYNQTKSKYWL